MAEKDLEQHRVGEVFRSRKNKVFRVLTEGEIRVAKIYAPHRARIAEAEFRLLKKCAQAGLRVPVPLETFNGSIVMTYIDGKNVSDLVDGILEGSSTAGTGVSPGAVAEGVADWLAGFHRAFGFEFCRGDTILRNFILSEHGVYGLDFEEAHSGDPISDLGEICANILGMRPQFGPANFRLASELANRYWIASGRARQSEMGEPIARALEHYARFRDDGPLLEGWARRFREEGPRLLEEPVGKI